MTPAAIETPHTNTRIDRSGVTLKTIVPNSAGTAPATSSARSRRISHVTTSAPAPAARPSSVLSVSSWRITRKRLAPSDSRVTISVWRARARASCRLATLAHATTSTISAAAMISRTASSRPGY